jgi:glycosyltransferase involved in cell wall biosynthesis
MKLIKFDTLYPASYLDKKISDSYAEVKKMKFKKFHSWLISMRMNYSDFYTYNLKFYGWDADEFFLNNDIYLEKCGKYYFRITYHFRKLFHRFRNMLSHVSVPFAEVIIQKHIKATNPDVLLIREQVFIRSKFWERYSKDKLVVSRMDCGIPKDWTPLSFDMIYSNIPTYVNFFKSLKIDTLSNSNGFDSRLLNELKSNPEKKHEIIFIGGLGEYTGFLPRTEFFEELISLNQNKFNFQWWGYKTGNFNNHFPNLARSYMGPVAGKEMFELYSSSKVVINDYGGGVGGVGVNQRIFEVLGVGTLLLTKESETIKDWQNYLVTYSDVEDCANKIMYYLNNKKEREKIAKAGQDFVLKNYNYKDLMAKLSDELKQAWHDKFK